MSGALTPLSNEARPAFAWLEDPRLKRVVAALEAAERDCVRFVGGCVRDSLLSERPKDFDVATTLLPQAAMAALEKAGLGVAPTGLDHGTVTAIADHQGVEVTTLRADVSTDGRRATVAFTRDWSVDAGRRDFTINAIYLTPAGALYDPVGGVADIDARRVRFIGDPGQRIREDFLRILRFFRFSARYCETFDAAGLSACAALKDGIEQLSAERIGAETAAILAHPRAAFALEAMNDAGVLEKIWPAPADLAAAARMKSIAPDAPAPLMLAALWPSGGEGVGSRLRLSNAEKAMRSAAADNAAGLAAAPSDHDLRLLLYRLGRDRLADAALLAAARGDIDENAFHALHQRIDAVRPPVFAVSGRHVLELGVAPGPTVAALLSAVEAQWIAEDFPGEARQFAILKETVAAG